MGPYDYEVADIRGEYVYLKRTDIVDNELFMIAMALLPPAVDIGVKLHYENFEYNIV